MVTTQKALGIQLYFVNKAPTTVYVLFSHREGADEWFSSDPGPGTSGVGNFSIKPGEKLLAEEEYRNFHVNFSKIRADKISDANRAAVSLESFGDVGQDTMYVINENYSIQRFLHKDQWRNFDPSEYKRAVFPNEYEAGPILNNYDAQSKCYDVCVKHGGWDGNWRTTEIGIMSVCECKN